MTTKTEISVGIASEADGDIAGFYVFTDETDAAFGASGCSDAWQFVNDHPDEVISFDTLAELIDHVQSEGLVITEEFGITVY